MTFQNNLFKNFIKPWGEPFLLSILAHIIFILFIWSCCQIHVMFVPHIPREKVIEIEFI